MNCIDQDLQTHSSSTWMDVDDTQTSRSERGNARAEPGRVAGLGNLRKALKESSITIEWEIARIID